jgi:hypothetical protein
MWSLLHEPHCIVLPWKARQRPTMNQYGYVITTLQSYTSDYGPFRQHTRLVVLMLLDQVLMSFFFLLCLIFVSDYWLSVYYPIILRRREQKNILKQYAVEMWSDKIISHSIYIYIYIYNSLAILYYQKN